jgi:hypothetical protein
MFSETDRVQNGPKGPRKYRPLDSAPMHHRWPLLASSGRRLAGLGRFWPVSGRFWPVSILLERQWVARFDRYFVQKKQIQRNDRKERKGRNTWDSTKPPDFWKICLR